MHPQNMKEQEWLKRFGGFHRIGPLGRFDLVVAKSVHVWLAGMSPSHAIFLRLGTGACVPRPWTGACVRRPRVEP